MHTYKILARTALRSTYIEVRRTDITGDRIPVTLVEFAAPNKEIGVRRARTAVRRLRKGGAL